MRADTLPSFKNSDEPVELFGARPGRSRCFGCSPQNAIGLGLTMRRTEGAGLVSTFRVPERFESYPGVVHGGIVSTILDEVMGNVPAVLEGKLCFTVTLRVKYIAPLRINQLYRCIARRLDDGDSNGDLYKVDGTIETADTGEVVTFATATYKWIELRQATSEMVNMSDYAGHLKP